MADVVKNTSSNKANTNIIAYQEKILALNEAASPVSIQLSDLSTLGDYTFDGQITRRLTAHPRFDYRKQELMTYSYIDLDQRLMYYRLNNQNKLIAEKAVDWPYPAMMHDFINTENYVIFPIFPCTMSFTRMNQGKSLFMWFG
jgi:carotenoid cleavage dioxygenase-like enzyme